ncbi:MAG: hypothetical protein HQK49_14285 [Oligoflexia bacterium]|nr:hypothetical protein [Oligoflexia bacterium]
MKTFKFTRSIIANMFFAMFLTLLFTTGTLLANSEDVKEAMKKAKSEGIQLVDIIFATKDGKQIKGLTIPVDSLQGSFDNMQATDGSSIPGYGGVTSSDLLLKLDPKTLNSYPDGARSNKYKVGYVLSSVQIDEKKPFPVDKDYQKNMEEAVKQYVQELDKTKTSDKITPVVFSGNDQVKTLDIIIFDLDGSMKIVKTISVDKKNLDEIISDSKSEKGSIHKISFKGMEKELIVKLDANSFRVYPPSMKKNSAYIVGDVLKDNNTPDMANPRNVLKMQIERLQKAVAKETKKNGKEIKDAEVVLGPEVEFFLLDEKGQPIDDRHYFDLLTDPKNRSAKINELMDDLLVQVPQMGIRVEKGHTEVAPGQKEFVLRFDSALRMADNLSFTRKFLTDMSKQYGMNIDFRAKPFNRVYDHIKKEEKKGINGSGQHVHYSVRSASTKENLFHSKDCKYSDIGGSFIEGVLKHQSSMTVVSNPSKNSYFRLVPNAEAPVAVAWADKNRTCSQRSPETGGNPFATRMEIRSPDSTCNFHSFGACLIASGCDGIEKCMKLRPSVGTDNVWKMTKEEKEKKGITPLPGSVEEGIKLFQENCQNNSGLLPKEFVESTVKQITEKLSDSNDPQNQSPGMVTKEGYSANGSSSSH